MGFHRCATAKRFRVVAEKPDLGELMQVIFQSGVEFAKNGCAAYKLRPNVTLTLFETWKYRYQMA